MDVTLTPHQLHALEWLVTEITNGAPLLALRGLAGVGKSAMVPHLQAALAAKGLRTTVGAPTHRAAMILRQKGIDGADTLHAHALTPYFTPDYAHAARWLGGEVSCHWEQAPHPDVDGLPWLVSEQVLQNTEHAHRIHRHRGRIPAQKLLASLGIHGKDCFAGFGPKPGEGLLIIDEGSMVGRAMLTLCQEAFPQVLLIGDPGQLPPVKDEALLATIPGVDLTEIHRQAADSPIIQLAYRARQGEAFWRGSLTACEASGLGGAVVEASSADAAAFLEAPLIVWRNKTRLECTHAIRHALGYDKATLLPGEPLVCRTTSPADRALGFYNNGLYRIVDVNAHDPRGVTVADALGEEQAITVHLEELDGDQIPYQAIPFRFGYCLTAHTAQGGEWPTVYISRPDLVQYASFCERGAKQEDRAQWTYTAITRAKETLVFLTQHTFERTQPMAPKSGPISAPLLPPLAPDRLSPPATDPVTDPPDDIPEPSVPAAVTAAITAPAVEASRIPQDASQGAKDSGVVFDEAPAPVMSSEAAMQLFLAHPMLHGFLEHLQQVLRRSVVEEQQTVNHNLDKLLLFLQDWVQKTCTANEHAQYQLSSALDGLAKHGLPLLSPPYQAVVEAVSPQGYPVKLTITKATTPELVEELERLLPWMQGDEDRPGYGIPVPAEVTP